MIPRQEYMSQKVVGSHPWPAEDFFRECSVIVYLCDHLIFDSAHYICVSCIMQGRILTSLWLVIPV